MSIWNVLERVLREVSISEPVSVDYLKIPTQARKELERLYVQWYKNRIEAFKSGDFPEEVRKQFIAQSEHWMKLVGSNEWAGVQNNKDEKIWITDGTEIVGLFFDNRFVQMGLDDYSRALKDADHILFWDGTKWYGKHDRDLTGNELTSQQMLSVQAFVAGKELGQNPNVDVAKSFSASKKAGNN